jgi:hypothetical protein
MGPNAMRLTEELVAQLQIDLECAFSISAAGRDLFYPARRKI